VFGVKHLLSKQSGKVVLLMVLHGNRKEKTRKIKCWHLDSAFRNKGAETVALAFSLSNRAQCPQLVTQSMC
jgi:hypothetical protein